MSTPSATSAPTIVPNTSTTVLPTFPSSGRQPSQSLANHVIVPMNNPIHRPLAKTEQKESETSVLNPNHTITYQKVVDILKESYNFDETVKSTSLDILALYLKGQKIIYIESKTHCEKRLNSLMLPAIFLAAVCSILNFILHLCTFKMPNLKIT